jgi:hypothetical protein
MARLIYSAIMSLDGYIADADGRFEWAAPDEEVFAFVNELERPVIAAGWWTNTSCSSSRPWWAAAPGPCRTRSA